jgi:hypothetical protein
LLNRYFVSILILPEEGAIMTTKRHQTFPLRYGTVLALCSSLCFLVLSLLFNICPASAADLRLLTDAPASATTPAPLAQATPPQQTSKRWVRRRRTVGINRAALDALSQSGGQNQPSVTMDLFDAGTHRLELQPPQDRPNRTRVWRGRFRGEPGSDVNFVSHDDVLIGTVLSDNRLYKLESAGAGLHQLIEIDVEALPPDHHPLVVPDAASDAAPVPGPTPNDPGPPTAFADDGSQVDLLVVYTTTAKTQEGGQAAMEALIALGVDLANQAYSNSQIDLQLRLVHTAEVAYTESGTIDTDLSRLRSTNDGIMDQVHQLRDQYRADLVALIVDNGGNFCGIAYVMANGPSAGFASWAFSVTARDCIANSTLSHETGHNMGNAHDRATGGTGVFAYSYGYRNEVGQFRTIMAYPCPTVSCPRVKYFSNPRLLFNGRPLGIDHAADPANSADNSRSMNEVRQTVANWRVSSTDRTPPAAPRNLRLIAP